MISFFCLIFPISLPSRYLLCLWFFFKCHNCDYVSFSIQQLESLHNSFLVVQECCVHWQSVFWELKKCNYMLRYLVSLTHLLISSCQCLALDSWSSPAPGDLCVAGGVLAHSQGGATCAWASCPSPFCFCITACIFRHWCCWRQICSLVCITAALDKLWLLC